MTNLKPCPFCGCEAELNVCRESLGATVEAFVVCRGCHCDVGSFSKEEFAVDAWNTREYRTCKNVTEHYAYGFKCSSCDFEQYDGDTPILFDYEYCPHCGDKVVD